MKKLKVTASMDDQCNNNLIKERSKLTKYFYKNGQREKDHNKVLKKSAERTRIFLKLKTICSLNDKVEYAITAPYWIITITYYTIKYPAMPPLLADENFFGF